MVICKLQSVPDFSMVTSLAFISNSCYLCVWKLDYSPFVMFESFLMNTKKKALMRDKKGKI